MPLVKLNVTSRKLVLFWLVSSVILSQSSLKVCERSFLALSQNLPDLVLSAAISHIVRGTGQHFFQTVSAVNLK